MPGRIHWTVSFTLLVIPFTNAKAQTPPEPKVFPSTPVSDSRFAYIYRPGNVHVRPQGHISADDVRPAFDRNTAELLKRYCTSTDPKYNDKVDVLASPKEADYVAFYFSGIRDHLMVVRNDGKVIWSRKGISKAGLIKGACKAMVCDHNPGAGCP